MEAILKVIFVLYTKLFLMVTNKICVNITFGKIMEVEGKFLLVTISLFIYSRWAGGFFHAVTRFLHSGVTIE